MEVLHFSLQTIYNLAKTVPVLIPLFLLHCYFCQSPLQRAKMLQRSDSKDTLEALL